MIIDTESGKYSIDVDIGIDNNNGRVYYNTEDSDLYLVLMRARANLQLSIAMIEKEISSINDILHRDIKDD